MSESEYQESEYREVPEGTTSAIPGRDDANPADRDVLEGDRDLPDRDVVAGDPDLADRDVVSPATEMPEPDVMGGPDAAHPDVMGARRPLPDETLGDDLDGRLEP